VYNEKHTTETPRKKMQTPVKKSRKNRAPALRGGGGMSQGWRQATTASTLIQTPQGHLKMAQ